MAKYPCGICHKGVRSSAVLCNGLCKHWFHKKCIKLPEVDYKKICYGQILDWECKDCNIKTITNRDRSEKVNELLERINNLNDKEIPNLENSLSLAAEAGNVLLEQNETLKQELHNVKKSKSEELLELEDRIRFLEQELVNRKQFSLVKEEEFMAEINSLQFKLKNINILQEELIVQSEQNNTEFLSQLNNLKEENIVLKEKLKQMEMEASINTNTHQQSLCHVCEVHKNITSEQTPVILSNQSKNCETVNHWRKISQKNAEENLTKAAVTRKLNTGFVIPTNNHFNLLEELKQADEARSSEPKYDKHRTNPTQSKTKAKAVPFKKKFLNIETTTKPNSNWHKLSCDEISLWMENYLKPSENISIIHPVQSHVIKLEEDLDLIKKCATKWA